jgi:hypothetical protein
VPFSGYSRSTKTHYCHRDGPEKSVCHIRCHVGLAQEYAQRSRSALAKAEPLASIIGKGISGNADTDKSLNIGGHQPHVTLLLPLLGPHLPLPRKAFPRAPDTKDRNGREHGERLEDVEDPLVGKGVAPNPEDEFDQAVDGTNLSVISMLS